MLVVNTQALKHTSIEFYTHTNKKTQQTTNHHLNYQQFLTMTGVLATKETYQSAQTQTQAIT